MSREKKLVKNESQNSDLKFFDRLESMPDVSLKELYYLVKASRERLKTKYNSMATETKFTDI